MLEALAVELSAAGDDRCCKVVILRARGPAFSRAMPGELTDGDEVAYTELFALCTSVMEQVRRLPQPVIAEVHALATAAGCQLVATCDLAVASEAASFATPGVKIGLFCSTPAVALVRAVSSPKHALEMLPPTGAPIDAREAERLGLVNRVVSAGELGEATLALARQIASAAGATLALGKRAFYEQVGLDRPAAYQVAARAMVENALQPDAQEGMHAFLEKRPPRWRT